MNVTLLKALAVLAPVAMLLTGSVLQFTRDRTICSLLQLLGAGSLVVVVLTHVAEALHAFPWMGWGLENSVGHCIDLSAVLVAPLFPIGYLLHALRSRRPR